MTQQTRPNIIFMICDDLGWTDMGNSGSEYYETPNLDEMVETGIKFTNWYSCGPNCAPARAGIMTGQYNVNNKVWTVGDGFRGKEEFRKMIPPPNQQFMDKSQVTLAEAMQRNGYRTVQIGKWHLGDREVDYPIQHGFDEQVLWADWINYPKTCYWNFTVIPNEYIAPETYLTDYLTDKALEYIERPDDKPFFMYFAHFAPHVPLEAKNELVDKYRRKPPKDGHCNPVYAAMVESIDESIEKIVNMLKKTGKYENTIFIFTSDHGGVGGYKSTGINAEEITDNAPLKGGKGQLYEGGVRVPMIMRWPAGLPAGKIVKTPYINIDFYPTLIDLSGGDLPPEQALDGLNITEGIVKDDSECHHDSLFWHFPGYLQADIDKGIWRTTPCGSILKKKYKLIEFFETGRLELYDLKNDLSEKNDLFDKMPELVKKMHTELKLWRKNNNAPMPCPKIEPN